MAMIQFDKNKLHVQVLVGIQENFKPDKETLEIYTRATTLREKLVKLQEKVINPELDAIQELVEKFNKKFIPTEKADNTTPKLAPTPIPSEGEPLRKSDKPTRKPRTKKQA